MHRDTNHDPQGKQRRQSISEEESTGHQPAVGSSRQRGQSMTHDNDRKKNLNETTDTSASDNGNGYAVTGSVAHTSLDACASSSSSSSIPFQSKRMQRYLEKRKSSSNGKGTESSASRLSIISAKLSTLSESLQRRRLRKRRARLSNVFMHKRRTFPFASPGVLEREVNRFTNPSEKHQRPLLKKQPRRRRRSLAHILTAFKSATSLTWHPPLPPQRTLHSYSSVRSSMLVHISDEGIQCTPMPETLYDDFSSISDCSTSSMNIIYAKYPVIQNYDDDVRQGDNTTSQARNRHSDPGYKSRKQKGRANTDGTWFYSWIQHHPRQKQHRAKVYNSSSSPTGTADSDKEPKSNRYYYHPPTISDLSSLSTPLSKFAPSSTRLKSIQFSAFWHNSCGQSGKQTVQVSGNSAVAMICKQRSWIYERCCLQFYSVSNTFAISSLLFLCGFICFPLWWIGAWIHWRQCSRTKQGGPRDPESQFMSVTSPWIFGWLNCCMTGLSLVLSPMIIGLAIWYSFSA